MKKAISLLELVLYVAFVGFIGVASFAVISQFFKLNKVLYSYKEFKISFLDFEKDFINLITDDYRFYTGGNKIVLSGDNNLVGFACSGNILKADFDTGCNITAIVKNYKNLTCRNLSGYFQTGIHLDLDLKFEGSGLVLHYYFK